MADQLIVYTAEQISKHYPMIDSKRTYLYRDDVSEYVLELMTDITADEKMPKKEIVKRLSVLLSDK